MSLLNSSFMEQQAFTDMFDEILIINLKNAKGRMQQMEAHLDSIGLTPWTRMEAVDGKKLSNSELQQATTPSCNRLCTSSMVGCYLSHRAAWKYAIDHGRQTTLILEDDARLTSVASQLIWSAMQSLPDDWDILYLGCFTCDSQHPMEALLNWTTTSKQQVGPNLVKPTQVLGSHAYCVSHNGARKLLQTLPKAAFHIDWQISHNINLLNVFAVNPNVAYQTDMSTSTISSKAPVLLNSLVSQIKLGSKDERSLSWLLSEHIFKLGSDHITLTGWSIFIALSACFFPRSVMAYLVLDYIVAKLSKRNVRETDYLVLVLLCVPGIFIWRYTFHY